MPLLGRCIEIGWSRFRKIRIQAGPRSTDLTDRRPPDASMPQLIMFRRRCPGRRRRRILCSSSAGGVRTSPARRAPADGLCGRCNISAHELAAGEVVIDYDRGYGFVGRARQIRLPTTSSTSTRVFRSSGPHRACRTQLGTTSQSAIRSRIRSSAMARSSRSRHPARSWRDSPTTRSGCSSVRSDDSQRDGPEPNGSRSIRSSGGVRSYSPRAARKYDEVYRGSNTPDTR